ncbi:unnamed protein product [Ascophyllum nodosum]
MYIYLTLFSFSPSLFPRVAVPSVVFLSDGTHLGRIVISLFRHHENLLVTDLQQRDPDTFKPLHVVSMTIRDSAEESAAAASDVLELCKMLDACEDLNTEASKLLNGFRSRTKRTVLHQVCHI